jgi:hypothetical protein
MRGNFTTRCQRPVAVSILTRYLLGHPLFNPLLRLPWDIRFLRRGKQQPFLQNLYSGSDVEHISGWGIVRILHVHLLEHVFDGIAGTRFDGALVYRAGKYDRPALPYSKKPASKGTALSHAKL